MQLSILLEFLLDTTPTTTTIAPTTPITTTIAPTTPTPASSACRFEHHEKGIIDFSFIGRTDERAAYTDEITRTASNFSMFSFYFLLCTIKYID
jgi:hypothetical protein